MRPASPKEAAAAPSDPQSASLTEEYVPSYSHTPLCPSSPVKRPASLMDSGSSSTPPETSKPVAPLIKPEVPRFLPGPATKPVQTEPKPDHSLDDSAMEVDSSAESEPDQPSLETLRKLINQDLSSMPLVGSIGFVISNRWLNKIITSEDSSSLPDQENADSQPAIGKIDNSDLLCSDDLSPTEANIFTMGEPVVLMRPGLTMGNEYTVLSEPVFQKLAEQYGVTNQTHIIRRHARNCSPDAEKPEVMYEVYPPIVTIRLVRTAGVEFAETEDAPSKRIVVSCATRYHDFLKRVKEINQLPLAVKVQVWQLELPLSTDQSSLKASKPAPQRLFLTESDFEKTASKSNLDFPDTSADEKYNGRLDMLTIGLAQNCTLIFKPNKKTLKLPLRPRDLKGSKLGKSESQKAAAPEKQVIQKPTSRMDRLFPEAGLVNLGNTCYMNSALQCLRSVEELSVYFLSGKARDEINRTNLLGFNGDIANRYSDLLYGMFSTRGTYRPSGFRTGVGRHYVQMLSWQQQDSQEFLNFIIDGLHEDLDRISKKPYMENPDSDKFDVSDPVVIQELGQKYQSNHAARNDSIIVDLFNGFYKNTMVCPDCSKISVTFDPFTSLTLQLPQSMSYIVTYLPLSGKPIKLELELDGNTSVEGLKKLIGRKVPGANPEAMIMAEVYSHAFHKVFLDHVLLREARIKPNDIIIVYQLERIPSNYPRKAAARRNQSMLDLYSSSDTGSETDGKQSSSSRAVYVSSRLKNGPSPVKSMVSYPFLIMLTDEESLSEEVITRKITEKVSQLTTFDISPFGLKGPLDSMSDTATIDVTVSDQIEPASTSDEITLQQDSSADDSKVDTEKADPDSAVDSARGFEKSNRMFELGVFRVGTAINAFECRRQDLLNITPFADRVSQVKDSDTSNSAKEESGPGNGSSEETFKNAQVANTITPPSESENEAAQYINPKSSRSKGFDRRMKKKGQRSGSGRRAGKTRSLTREHSDLSTTTPSLIVGEGEAIMVDWNSEVYHQLFGRDAIENAEVVVDSNLERRRKIRSRNRNGGVTLEECFTETTKPEVLSPGEAWYCSACKEHRCATKTLELWTLPDILILHLKRFYNMGTSRQKDPTIVEFPLEGLDLNSLVNKNDGTDFTYDLIAVDNHFGGLGGGHYTAFAKSFVNGKWYDFNDSSVRVVDNPESVVTASAYLLFYRRRSTTPLGPKYVSDLVEQFRTPTVGEELDDSALKSGNISSSSSDSGASRRSFLSRGLRSIGGAISPSEETKKGIRSLPSRATRGVMRIFTSDDATEDGGSTTDTADKSMTVAGEEEDDEDDEDEDEDDRDDDHHGSEMMHVSSCDGSGPNSGLVTPAESPSTEQLLPTDPDSAPTATAVSMAAAVPIEITVSRPGEEETPGQTGAGEKQ